MSRLRFKQALHLWRQALSDLVRANKPDLSARQMAILMTVYLMPPPHTVRGLSALLNLRKPAVTRALDRLAVVGFIRRRRDQKDKRNIFVEPTVPGAVYLSDFSEVIIAADKKAEITQRVNETR